MQRETRQHQDAPRAAGALRRRDPVAPYGRPGTSELPEAVRPYVKTNRAVLIENHGAVTWAETVRQAYYNMEFLEKCCKIYAVANFMIGGAHDIPNEESIREQLAAFQKDAMADDRHVNILSCDRRRRR